MSSTISFDFVNSFKLIKRQISYINKINMKDKTNNLETVHKSETDNTITTKRRDNSDDQKIILIDSLMGFQSVVQFFYIE